MGSSSSVLIGSPPAMPLSILVISEIVSPVLSVSTEVRAAQAPAREPSISIEGAVGVGLCSRMMRFSRELNELPHTPSASVSG